MTAASSLPPSDSVPTNAAGSPDHPAGPGSPPPASPRTASPAAPPPPPGLHSPEAGPTAAASTDQAAPVPANADQAETAAGEAPQIVRRHPRNRLDGEPPARIALANRQRVFVTILDISSGGCCIVRKGRMDLAHGDNVLVDLWTRDIETIVSIHARVCWSSHQGATSRAGLRFIETNHRVLRQIGTYLEHYQRPPDDTRPRAWMPTTITGAGAEPQPGPAPANVQAPQSDRARGVLPRGLAASSGRAPGAMPRPHQLTAQELQRRMRPAHRQEVARIAEETGIHIQTLYGWLRSLQLEGEIHPDRPLDAEAWSAADKVSALLHVTGMDAAARASYCSLNGITEEQLGRWRQAAQQANEKPLLILRAEEELQRLQVRDRREIRRLRRDLLRSERSAAISEELLQVVRKLQSLWQQDETP